MDRIEKIAVTNNNFNEYGFNEYGYNKYNVLNTKYINFDIKDLSDFIVDELSPNEGIETDWERVAVLEATRNYKELLGCD